MPQLLDTSLFNDASLVSYYTMEDANDDKASNNLTNNNTVTFTTGKFNNAGSFNGSNQSLSLTNGSTFFTGSSAKAFSCWINPSSQPGTGVRKTFLSWGNTTHRLLLAYKDTGGTKYISISDGATNQDVSAQTLSNGTWYNIVASLSGSTLTIWLNGVSIGTPTVNIVSGSQGFGIGDIRPETGENFPGLIDDVAIFSRALTQTDVNIINYGDISGGYIFQSY